MQNQNNPAPAASSINEAINELKTRLNAGYPADDLCGRVALAHAATILSCELLETAAGSEHAVYKATFDHLLAAEKLLDNLDVTDLVVA